MAKNKKILIITPGFFPLFGGMEEQCFILAQELIREGWQVDLLTEQTEPSFLQEEEIDGIHVYRLPYIEKRNVHGFLKLSLAMTKFLSRNQKNYDFCLIRTLTFPAILIGALKAMKIVQLRTWITAETGGPNDDISTIKRSRLRRIFTFCISRHNYLNSICEDNYRHYIELGLPKNKLTQIYNGIESEIYAKSSYPTKINNFLYLGRLSKTKGVCELLAAFKAISTKHPDKKLYIGGDGTEKEAIIDYIAKNKLEKNISYEGYIDKLQKDAFYRKGECLILPSYSEGFPIVILEATIRKKAIISTSVSDLKKLFGDKIIFCQKRSASDLSDKIELALGKDFNSPIYDNIVSQIDIKVVAKKITDLFT